MHRSASSRPPSTQPAFPSTWSSSAITEWSTSRAPGSRSISSPTSPASTPSALCLYGKTEEDRARVYNQLKKASSQFVVYRLKNVPANLNFNQNPREGDPVVIATGPYAIRAHAPPDGKPDQPPTPGMHGFDPAQSPGDEGQLLCRRTGYSEGKDGCSL